MTCLVKRTSVKGDQRSRLCRRAVCERSTITERRPSSNGVGQINDLIKEDLVPGALVHREIFVWCHRLHVTACNRINLHTRCPVSSLSYVYGTSQRIINIALLQRLTHIQTVRCNVFVEHGISYCKILQQYTISRCAKYNNILGYRRWPNMSRAVNKRLPVVKNVSIDFRYWLALN